MPQVAIDAGPLKSGDSVRGIGVYVAELTKRLAGITLLDSSKKLSDFKVVHFTKFNPFRLSVPFKKPKGVKFVLTIYDLIHLIFPQNYPPGIKGKLLWQINRLLIRKNIDAIITISETSKKDICRLLGISPEKVFVTYLAPKPVYKVLPPGSWEKETTKKYNLPSKFALYTGDINYNKNIPNLVNAVKKAGLKLVIAGKQAPEIEKMDLNHPELMHLKNIEWTDVVRLGFIDDEELNKIYNLAEVYVQVSFYEGFGLPELEAIACNTPLVVSKMQCHVEVLGKEISYCDPADIEDIAASILKPNKNVKLPRLYSWEKTAKDTQKVYDLLTT